MKIEELIELRNQLLSIESPTKYVPIANYGEKSYFTENSVINRKNYQAKVNNKIASTKSAYETIEKIVERTILLYAKKNIPLNHFHFQLVLEDYYNFDVLQRIFNLKEDSEQLISTKSLNEISGIKEENAQFKGIELMESTHSNNSKDLNRKLGNIYNEDELRILPKFTLVNVPMLKLLLENDGYIFNDDYSIDVFLEKEKVK